VTLLVAARHRVLNAFVLFLGFLPQVMNHLQAAFVGARAVFFEDLVDSFDRFFCGHGGEIIA
jgi:hypothetical protein